MEASSFASFDDRSATQKKKLHLQLKKALAQCFKDLHNEISSNGDMNSYLSGSTLTVILLIDDYVYTANVGDSKAILLK